MSTQESEDRKMKIDVHLCAFRFEDDPVKVRRVEVPDADLAEANAAAATPEALGFALAELAFKWGQNDFQPIPGTRSVSCEDVVEIPGFGRYVVEGCGFSELEGSIATHAAKVARPGARPRR